MKELLLAISFLTILPVYNKSAREDEMARSLFYYPAVGLLIGLGLSLVAYMGKCLALGWAGDVLIIVFWIIASGGLHLDGLMDSADGIFSGRERERKLEIMKDSRVGAMGAIALVALILLKISFLGLIPYPLKYWALLIAPALGRTMILFSLSYYPYARTGPGLGKCFGDQVSKMVFPVTMFMVLLGAYFADGLRAMIVVVITAIIAAFLSSRIARILGGQTGDTYGALCEISETMFLITAGIGIKALGL
jgi:adenosylcobinamide-GDP ribazoletransferase